MVWIHGGGNVWGSSEQSTTDLELAVNENVVVVAIQFRAGPLGWFAHPALRDGAQAQHADDKAACFAILDQIAALRWVKQNIGSFGGDRQLRDHLRRKLRWSQRCRPSRLATGSTACFIERSFNRGASTASTWAEAAGTDGELVANPVRRRGSGGWGPRPLPTCEACQPKSSTPLMRRGRQLVSGRSPHDPRWRRAPDDATA